MSRDRYLDPNLAREPYENARPVGRLALALWILALLAAGAALWTATTARREAGTRHQALARATAEMTAARESISRLRARLESQNLAERNERTEFLNARIAERSFSWTELFDALGEVLPRGVRVQDLAPQGLGNRDRRQEDATAHVGLRIRGEAETDEALLQFVDRLYAHRAFREPNLARESTRKDARLEFDLTVGYRPGWLEAASAMTADAGLPAAAADAPAATAAQPRPATPAEGAVAGALPPAGTAPAGTASAGTAPGPAAGAGEVALLPGRAPATPRPQGPARPPFQRESTLERSARAARAEVEAEQVEPPAPRRQRSDDGAGTATGGGVLLPSPLRPYASPPEGFR